MERKNTTDNRNTIENKSRENKKIYSQYMYSFPHKKSYVNIEKKIIEDAFMKTQGSIGLYIHIPFCSSKCGYCNLFSIVKNDEEYIGRYVTKILEELDFIKDKLDLRNIKITSLVIGGGTPLILTIPQMESIFSKIEQIFSIKLENIDFQMETSPNETTYEILSYLKERGLKRLSIGVQSFIEEELESIYRYHSAEKAILALDNIKKVGFQTKNLDIIYGLPFQSEDSLTYSLEKAVSYDFEEIFLYPLYVRENTVLGKQNLQIDQDKQLALYIKGSEFLRNNGYSQISMRRFSKKPLSEGKSCGFEKSISLGCGGRTYLGNLHFCEEYSSSGQMCKNIIENYLNKKDFFENIKGYILDDKLLKIRYVLKNLGHIYGINMSEYSTVFGEDILVDFPSILDFIDEKYIVKEYNILKLSDDGIALSDYILYTFVPESMKEQYHE